MLALVKWYINNQMYPVPLNYTDNFHHAFYCCILQMPSWHTLYTLINHKYLLLLNSWHTACKGFFAGNTKYQMDNTDFSESGIYFAKLILTVPTS